MRSRYGSACFQRLERGVFIEMAQEAHDQLGADAELLLAIVQRAQHAVGDDRERNAAIGVGLRIEEHLDVARIVGLHALQVRHDQIVEVLLRRAARSRPDNRCRESPAGSRTSTPHALPRPT